MVVTAHLGAGSSPTSLSISQAVARHATYLFLVIVPPEPRLYVSMHPDGLLLRKSVYWHSLAKEDPVVDAKKDAKKRVDIPKANLLTVDSLRTLVNAADPGGEPS